MITTPREAKQHRRKQSGKLLRRAWRSDPYRTVVVFVSVLVVSETGGLVTSVPLVSFSIITPFASELRRTLVVTSTSCFGGATWVDSVVELEKEDCAKPAPDINVSAAAAAKTVFNIVCTP